MRKLRKNSKLHSFKSDYKAIIKNSIFFNNAPEAMLVFNKQGIIIIANHQFEKLLGYKNTDIIGCSVNNILPKLQYNYPQLNKLYQTTIIAAHKEATYLQLEVSLNSISLGLDLLFIASLKNIKKTHTHQKAFNLTEENFQMMANYSPNMIWVTDEKTKPIFANRAWLDFVGLNEKQYITYKDWFNNVHPDDISKIFTAYQTIDVSNSNVITTEYRLHHASGEWRWVFDQGIPMFDKNGKFTGYIGSLIDITERKQIETELRIAATAFEAHEAMIITDVDSIILRVNQAFTDITGYTAKEAIGKKMNFLQSGYHDEAFYKTMWKKIIETGAWQGEIWDRRKNGEIYPKWLTITAVTDTSGNVTHYVGTQSDISALKAAEQKIRLLAYYDPLTQLPNKYLLEQYIEQSTTTIGSNYVALLVLGLTRFRSINNSLGYIAGDELLKKVGTRLSACLSGGTKLARLGGDKFAILVDNIIQPEDAARFAGILVAELMRPFKITQYDDIRIGVSIGISIYAKESNNANLLIEQAESALYQAKNKGYNRFAYFSDELTRIARERMELEAHLHNAIEESQLCVFYQPQIDIKTNRMIGAEALVRWNDPIYGLIPPDSFIGVAEECGLIHILGEWVLKETCRQGKIWLDLGLPPIRLAVNVSPQQFKYSNITALVSKVLIETGFPAELLELEITENGLMENNENKEHTVRVLKELRALGIYLAIDDFGTGYSSLSYLKRFPVQVLKIDKGFIKDIPNSYNDMEIAATIIAMAHTLGFKVLAEGVETLEQLEFLEHKGCNSYQGYLKSEPLPADEFVHLLTERKF